jgi:outer membrane lipoprotein-sorting protein
MKRKPRKVGVAVALAVTLMAAGSGAPGAAQQITDFSADQVVIGAKGKVEQESKLSVAGDWVRIDKVVPADAKMSFIYRRDLKQAVTINPGKKIYFEGSLDEKSFSAAMGLPAPAAVERSAGLEIDFKKAKKTVTNTVWVSDRLGIPLRVKTYEGRVTELRNLKEGKPDAALFETPKDFKKAATLKDVLPSDPFLDDED